MTTTIQLSTARVMRDWLLNGEASVGGMVGADSLHLVISGSAWPDSGPGYDPGFVSAGGGVADNGNAINFIGQIGAGDITDARLGTFFASPTLTTDTLTTDLHEQGDYLSLAPGDVTVTFESGDAALTISAYALGVVEDWVAGSAFPAEDRYVGLLDTLGVEVAGGSYARQPPAGFTFGYGRLFEGMPAVTVRYVAVFNDVAAGDEILRVQLGADVAVGAGDAVMFESRMSDNYSGASDDVILGEP